MRDMSGAFGMRAVAVRDKFVLFEINAAAEPRVADDFARFARFRRRFFDAVSIRLRAVEAQRDRNIERFSRVDFIIQTVYLKRKLHRLFFGVVNFKNLYQTVFKSENLPDCFLGEQLSA